MNVQTNWHQLIHTLFLCHPVVILYYYVYTAFYLRWFRQLNDHCGVRGEAYYLYKPKGRSRTVGLSGDEALCRLKEGLLSPQMAFVYHSYNHYFCPIGFEDSPNKAVDAYRFFS